MMIRQKKEKLNPLFRDWPSGTVMTQFWFEQHGISRKLSHSYVKSGWITKIGQGAFIKAGDHVDWMGALYAIQRQLNLKLHLGGRALLELFGASHFIPLGSKGVLFIYTDDRSKQSLPKWFRAAFEERYYITHVSRGLFSEPCGIEILEQPNFSIMVSSKERALMEVLALVPKVISYSHAYLLFQGQETLRVNLIQKLLVAEQEI
jgi:hypothetical protein